MQHKFQDRAVSGGAFMGLMTTWSSDWIETVILLALFLVDLVVDRQMVN